MKKRKLLLRALNSPQSLRFSELVALAEAFGFRQIRTSGGHHIFGRPDIARLVNLQSVNGEAKPYQLRQLLELVETYNPKLEDES